MKKPTLTPEDVAAMPTPFDRDPRRDSDSMDAWRYYGGNRGLAGAWRKGALAALDGASLTDVPYVDHRTSRGGITFSRSFEIAWCEGWHFATYGDSTTCTLRPNHTAVPCSFDYPVAPGETVAIGGEA